MKFDVLVVDPPYLLNDKLTMSKVKRGASAHYDELTCLDLMKLDIPKLSKPDSVLALWVPSSLIQIGLDIMKKWEFRQTQTFIWVKTKKDPLKDIKKQIKTNIKNKQYDNIENILDFFDFNDITRMNLGRWFRQTHELALIGVKGKVYSKLENKSQRSVLFDVPGKHSSKPEGLQDRLELMVPNGDYLEMFARRDRDKWLCIGNEAPTTLDQDIRISVANLIAV